MKTWPITQAQQGIWLGQVKSPESTRYNTAEFIELNIALDSQKWLVAASRVLHRCTALNVQFVEMSGVLSQNPLCEAQRVKVLGEYLDLANEVEPLDSAKRFLTNWYAQPYNLSEGHLYRHVLIKLATNHYYWALGAHHIALDGFSFSLLTNRVVAAYDGESVTSDEAQYLAILEEDTKYQHSTAYAQDKAYWLETLRDFPSAATLRAGDEPSGDEKIKVATTLSSNLINRLDAQAQEVGANWTELLLAAVAFLIHENTGVARTIIGLPVANRFGSKAANTPCMHMNIVPVCIQFEDCERFAMLLQQVCVELKKARRHFRFRYETLGSLAHVEPLPTRLFGPVVNILPFERQAECDGEPILSHTLSAGPVDDLAFIFIKHADGKVSFELEGQQSGYTHGELLVLQAKVVSLLGALSKTLDVPLELKDANLAMTSSPTELVYSKTFDVVSQFFACANATPTATALALVDGPSWTYAQLAEQVSLLASHLQALHQTSGNTILLLLPRSPRTIIAMLAVLAAKQRFVFIDVDAPIERNKRIVSDAKPSLALVDEQTALFMPKLDALLPSMNVTTLAAPNTMAVLNPLDESDEAYLIYTSGSTGQPKGVQVNHGALTGFIVGAREAYQVKADDTVLQFAPFHFDACIEEVFLTLTTGAKLVLRNDAMLDSFDAFIAEIARLQITVLDLPTAYWHELCRFVCESNLTQLGQVHTIIIGGEAINRHRIEAWRGQMESSIRVLNTYGPTETTVVATCIDLSQSNSTNSIGLPLPGRGAVVMRDAEHIAKMGERGELYLTGAGLATGYLGQTELTEAAFVSFWDPVVRQRTRAYRTGDMVRMLGRGQLDYLGREDAQLKISGYRIELGEIEAVMLENAAIVDAAITLLRDSEGHPIALAAHLVCETPWSLEAFRAQFSDQLPAPMLPVQVNYYAALPKTPANKIDRKRLAAASQMTNIPTELSDFERLIADVWRDILGVPSISRDDNFFSIGGQSLQCIQVAARLSNLLEKPVNVAFLFAHPKLSDLCDALNNETEQAQTLRTQWQEPLLEDVAAFNRRLAHIDEVKTVKLAQPTVLLTGATGFVGAQLLSALLASPNVNVICHVRATTTEAAFERLTKACLQQHLDLPDFTRVEILLADLSTPNLGLNAKDYDALGSGVTHVIHNAAHTSVLRDYTSLKAANTESTAELLLFAKRFSVPFNHVSTIAVAPLSSEPLAENFVALHDDLHDGYQQSKWAAERLVESAIEAGVNAQVYRLARVIGAKQTGFINGNDLVWRILRTGLRLKRLPDLSVAEPWTPVDVVARFIVAQTFAGRASQVFNVTPETSLHLVDLYQWLREFGFEFDSLLIADWVREAEQSSDENDLTIASFFKGQAQKSASNRAMLTDNTQFKQSAAEFKLSLAPFDRDDLAAYLQFAFEQGIVDAAQHPHAFLRLQRMAKTTSKEVYS
ncbi:amino acid adenylation domain-containing protein [Pseudoalteromonas xiamenensis]